MKKIRKKKVSCRTFVKYMHQVKLNDYELVVHFSMWVVDAIQPVAIRQPLMSVNEDNIETLVGSANIAISSPSIIKPDKKEEDDTPKVKFKGATKAATGGGAKSLGIS